MLAWYSIAQQWVMTTWNKQTSTILERKPVAGKSSEKRQTAKFNCHDFFYLEDFIGSIGIMLLKFRLLHFPDIFWNHGSWSRKEEILRSILSTSTSALDSLVVEVSESCLFSSNFVRLALASSAGLVSLSSFNHSSLLQCYPWSLRAKDLARGWTCGFYQIFASSTSSKTKMGKKFLAFSSWHKENLTRTKANLWWNNEIENSSRAQMKYHTAIRITCDNWRWILISNSLIS